VGVRVGVACSRNKLAYDFLKFVGGLMAIKWALKPFLGQSISIDENNTFELQIFNTKAVGATVLGGLWALE